MPDKTLLILDIKKNYDLVENHVNFISLNKGLINLNNCKQIYFANFIKEKKNAYKKLISNLLKIISSSPKDDIPFIELEINNLRNDRYNFIDRIINFLVIKRIIQINNFRKIKIITDNKKTLNIFDNLNIQIEKIDLTKNNQKNSFFRLRLFKFYLKSLFVVCFLKFIKINFSYKKNLNFFFSIYPNKFNYHDKENNDKFKLNFLLTDETHLNHNILQICKIILSQKQNKKFINIESFISLKYLFCLIIKNFFSNKKSYFNSMNFKIDNLDFTLDIKEFYTKSYLNRSKLMIYDNAINIFLKKFDIKNINLYLFEYSFGFYLINKIKSFSKKIEISGYQHGIFSENLSWLDVLGLIKDKNQYFPNKIFATNNYSKKDYEKKFGKNLLIKLSNFKKESNNLTKEIKINKKSKNIIVVAGTHDVADLYFFFKNTKRFEKYNIFFKLHPKNKYEIYNSSNIKKIDNLRNLDFCILIISQTSSLIYDFLKMKKEFFVIDIDYKINLVNTNVLNKIKIISRKKIHDKKFDIKV